MRTTNIKTYSELMQLESFEDRYRYLKLNGRVGVDTFGFDRIFNQKFYRSKEWLDVRDYVIVRDEGCDLGHPDHPIVGQRILIHHINPIDLSDILDATSFLMNPEYLITTIQRTHNAIHYGDAKLLDSDPVERFANDTCPWKLNR